jgi:hypothetical protein
MSAGMIAHQTWGLAVSKAAAASIATTAHKRIAILTAHVRTGRTCMEASVSSLPFYIIATSITQHARYHERHYWWGFPRVTKRALTEVESVLVAKAFELTPTKSSFCMRVSAC